MKNKHLFLIFLTLFSFSCSKDNVETCSRDGSGSFELLCLPVLNDIPITAGAGGASFDMTNFLEIMEDTLGGVLGYQLAVGYQNQIIARVSNGIARKDEDCYLGMNDCNIFNIASQTKTITAAALLTLMEDNNISVDDLISPYLPWTTSDYVQGLSFRHFLSHRTALPTFNSVSVTHTDWDEIKKYVTIDSPVDSLQVDNNPDNNVWNYGNINYATMRIIIPTLWKNLPSAPSELKNAESMTNELSTKYYEQYIKEYITNIANAPTASLKAPVPEDESTLYYSSALTEDGEKGSLYGKDWTQHGGGGGWFMSATDLVKVIMAIHENDEVLSPENRALMQGHPTLNWRTAYSFTSNHARGRSDGHGGDLYEKMHGTYITFPEGFYVVVMINSPIFSDGTGNSQTLFNYLVDAYLKSW